MNRLTRVWIALMVVIVGTPLESVMAQTAGKKPLPQVPITYLGDTDQTVIRRAQWIEGAKKEGALVWWGTIAAGETNKILAAFNKVYPFIKVEYWRGGGEEIAAKLGSEIMSGRYTVDLSLGGEEINLPGWREKGALAKFADLIPGIQKMDRRNYSKQGDWMRPGSNVFIAAYNTKLVSASEAPKSYEDLLDPKWKGKIGMTSDVKQWWSYALAEGGWGMEKTEDFLRKMKQQEPIWAPGNTALLTMLIAGEFKIAAQGYLYRYLPAKDKGAPVEWIRVNPVVVGGTGFIMSAGAPHPNAARLFLEWVFSPQGLVTYDKITAGGSAFPGMGTRQSKAVEGLKLSVKTEEVVLKAVELGLEDKYAKILGITK